MRKEEATKKVADCLIEALKYIVKSYNAFNSELYELACEESIEAIRYLFKITDIIDSFREKPVSSDQL